jgi:hypothetical protein
MMFSLVHSSRGRAAGAEEAVREWAAKRSGLHQYEHILSLDMDDEIRDYEVIVAKYGLRSTVNVNRTMVEAANRGAAVAAGDVIVVVSDDFGCPDQWDVRLSAVIGGRARAALLVHDGIDGRIMTLPILTRAYYSELGHVYHPAYRSMYADDDLTEVALRDRALIDARHLTFPHRHHSVGLSAEDMTYARQDSGRAWWHGWRVFQKRRIEAFGARERTLSVRAALAQTELYYQARVAGSTMRRWWLERLGHAGRAREARARTAVLRFLRRMTGVSGTDL